MEKSIEKAFISEIFFIYRAAHALIFFHGQKSPLLNNTEKIADKYIRALKELSAQQSAEQKDDIKENMFSTEHNIQK